MYGATKDKRRLEKLEQLMESGSSHAEIKSLIGDVPLENIADSDGTTLLHLASKYNNMKMIKCLIDAGSDVNVENSSGMTPLMFAVTFDRLEAAKLLLENNADVFAANSDGKNVLHMLEEDTSNASRLPFLKCFVDKMKKTGLDISDVAKSLQSANCTLAEIVCFHDAQLTRAFLQQGAIDSTDSYQSVHNAIIASKMQQVRTLLTHGPLFKKRRVYFLRWILLTATKSKPGCSAKIETFARQILHWNVLSKNEVSIIEHVLKKANEDSMKILLGIIPHVKKCGNRDVFVHIFGNPVVVDLMRNVKFNVNARGFNGQTALHVAVQNKLVKNVEFLLERGADPNAQDGDGETPMFEALWSPKNPNLSVKCVELLLLHGADVQTCDHGGASFVYYAARAANATSDLLELTLTHLALREAMGLPIEQLIYDQIKMRDRSRSLFENCREKLERTKERKLSDKITMFSVITKRTESLARCLNLLNCKNLMTSLDSQKNFNTFYDNILRDQLSRIVKMHHLKCKIRFILCESIELLSPYDLVIDKIISFFNYKDLLVLQ